MKDALARLEAITRGVLRHASSEWQLAELLANTTLTPMLLETVQALLAKKGWSPDALKLRMQTMLTALEKRNRKVLGAWLEAL